MNLQTLPFYTECFSSRTAIPWQKLGPCKIKVPLDSVGGHGDSPPEAGFSQSRRASPAAHQSTPNLPVSRCRSPFAFCRRTAPSEPDTQCCSSQVKIRHSAQQEHLDSLVPASPSASQPPLLKLRGLAASQPPALHSIPEACLEYHSSTAFLLLSPASGSGWRVARHTCWANTASPGAYRQHRWGYTPR